MTLAGSLPVCVECNVMIYANHACHGTRTRFQAGCRCVDCKDANNVSRRRWPTRRKPRAEVAANFGSASSARATSTARSSDPKLAGAAGHVSAALARDVPPRRRVPAAPFANATSSPTQGGDEMTLDHWPEGVPAPHRAVVSRYAASSAGRASGALLTGPTPQGGRRQTPQGESSGCQGRLIVTPATRATPPEPLTTALAVLSFGAS